MAVTAEKSPYDLEDRTFSFARRAMAYFKTLPRNQVNREISSQGIRAAGSVGANFIEANEALSRKDFAFRVRICRKEAKEAIYWFRLSEPAADAEDERTAVLQEATELMKIFGAIIRRRESE